MSLHRCADVTSRIGYVMCSCDLGRDHGVDTSMDSRPEGNEDAVHDH